MGETEALRLLGYGKKAAVAIEKIQFDPPRVAIGRRVSVSFVLRSKSRTPQDLLVDVAVHFVKEETPLIRFSPAPPLAREGHDLASLPDPSWKRQCFPRFGPSSVPSSCRTRSASSRSRANSARSSCSVGRYKVGTSNSARRGSARCPWAR